MKSLIYTLGVALVLLSSCAKEEPIDVKVADTRYYFEPQPERTDDEAVLRRAFFDKYDIHLLFNDTLRHDSICPDFNGDTHYFTELIDMYYCVGNYSVGSVQDRYKLFTTMEQKRRATEYLETQIQPHFSERMRPFSWLLVNEIAERADEYSSWTYPYAITGERCIAIALSTYFKLTPARVPAFTQQVLNIIAVKIAKNNLNSLSGFRALSEAYYGQVFASDSIPNDENTRILREAGFFSKGKDSWGSALNGIYPKADADLADYVRMSITYSQDKIKELYGQYPVILRKDSAVRVALESRGFIYNPEVPEDIVSKK